MQLDNFCNKIDTYSAPLGIAAGDVTSIKRDRDFVFCMLEALNTFKTYGENMTSYKDLLRYGNEDEVLPAFPAVPVLAAAPTLVAANVQKRFARIIQACVNSTNYSKTIGEDLGIEATITVFDPNLGKPIFKALQSSGGKPLLAWRKKKFQGVEIWKDAVKVL